MEVTELSVSGDEKGLPRRVGSEAIDFTSSSVSGVSGVSNVPSFAQETEARELELRIGQRERMLRQLADKREAARQRAVARRRASAKQVGDFVGATDRPSVVALVTGHQIAGIPLVARVADAPPYVVRVPQIIRYAIITRAVRASVQLIAVK